MRVRSTALRLSGIMHSGRLRVAPKVSYPSGIRSQSRPFSGQRQNDDDGGFKEMLQRLQNQGEAEGSGERKDEAGDEDGNRNSSGKSGADVANEAKENKERNSPEEKSDEETSSTSSSSSASTSNVFSSFSSFFGSAPRSPAEAANRTVNVMHDVWGSVRENVQVLVLLIALNNRPRSRICPSPDYTHMHLLFLPPVSRIPRWPTKI